MLDVLVFLFQCHVVDVMLKVAVSTDVTGLAASVAGLRERFECPSAVDVHGMPGGNVREGVCIAAGVADMGGCEWRNENGAHGGAGYVVGVGAE
jgi:hypothetical protein